MSETTVEDILEQISKLPPDQQHRLRQFLDQQEPPAKSSLDKRILPKPAPDSEREMK